MIPSLENRHSLGGRACPMDGGGGGSSSADSSTKTTTTNTDQRVVADNGASVVSVSGSGNSITTTDGGAIKGAGEVATTAIKTNATNVDHLLATADHLFTQQANTVQASLDLTKSLNSSSQAAYKDAANIASGNKELILAGMAVVAVVAFKSFGK